ncbi:MAG: DUF4292 domain-containing protein [Cytophagales bacterium]|nr:DUF4292 domain-containing protein [Cytophagales bacterium]
MNKHLVILFCLGFALVSCKDKLVNYNRDLTVDYFTFDYMTAKAKINYKDARQNLAATANIRIKKDSLIWMSVSKVRVEAARILITKDSLFVLDRLKKRYSKQGFDALSKQFDFEINYNLIESVILGNLIYPYKRERLESSEEYLYYDQRLANFLFNNYIGVDTRKLEKLLVEDVDTKSTISVNYGDFKEVNAEIFPFTIAASINYVEKTRQNIAINIGFSKAEIAEEPLRFPFSTPSKYRRF